MDTLIYQEDPPIGNSYRHDISSGLGGGVRYTRHRTKCGGTNYIGVEMFYQSYMKDFFLLRLVTVQCKKAGVPLFDTDEVLPMDPTLSPSFD